MVLTHRKIPYQASIAQVVESPRLSSLGELLPYRGNYYLWKYVPSVPAAAIFIVLFLLLSIVHNCKMYRSRMWFCIPFVVGSYREYFQLIGKGDRAIASSATNKHIPYMIQSTFLLVPPSEACSLIRVRWLTTIFVLGDVFSFMIQSSGAGFMSAGSNTDLGQNIVIAGLVIQVIFFGLFVAVTVTFHARFRQHGVAGSSVSYFPRESMLSMLYGTSAMILVRCIFRVIEYSMGVDGYLLENEWRLYIFDGSLMITTMVAF
ncbi:RTA1 like protein-domain-containing protein [Biscogniauxia sp. FL1348]|nr:RTA1 like protein-domain-containing protein [Biscogniauxia sp. FL1348]